MKKASILLFLFCGFSVFAQKNTFKVNPLGLIFGAAEVSYERVVAPKNSLEFSFAYANPKIDFKGRNEKSEGFGGELKYKLYMSNVKEAPLGIYAAPVVTYVNGQVDVGSDQGKFSYLAFGALAGYQWVFGKDNSGFAVDFNLGAQYIASITNTELYNSVDVSGTIIRLGLGIGYAW